MVGQPVQSMGRSKEMIMKKQMEKAIEDCLWLESDSGTSAEIKRVCKNTREMLERDLASLE